MKQFRDEALKLLPLKFTHVPVDELYRLATGTTVGKPMDGFDKIIASTLEVDGINGDPYWNLPSVIFVIKKRSYQREAMILDHLDFDTIIHEKGYPFGDESTWELDFLSSAIELTKRVLLEKEYGELFLLAFDINK